MFLTLVGAGMRRSEATSRNIAPRGAGPEAFQFSELADSGFGGDGRTVHSLFRLNHDDVRNTSQRCNGKSHKIQPSDYPHELDCRDLIWCANGVTIR